MPSLLGCGTDGCALDNYEIRILLDAGEAATVAAPQNLNDFATIRAGKELAQGHPFEVWRGMNCIYAPPDLPAA